MTTSPPPACERGFLLRSGFESDRLRATNPIAAAYSLQQQHNSAAETILIGDFGGGTSDFSILRRRPDGVRIRTRHCRVCRSPAMPSTPGSCASSSRPALGSESLTRGGKAIPAVPAWIYANLERWHYLSFLRTRNVLDILSTARKRAVEPEKIEALLAIVDEDLGYQLHQAVQRTKTALSTSETADFIFAGPDAGSVELRTSITRAEFERWIAPELTQIGATIDSLLLSTSSYPSDIDQVFLTGGTSFVPAVRALFESRFPGRVVTGNEFTSVSQGLALAR